jgi:hypothetical protein
MTARAPIVSDERAASALGRLLRESGEPDSGSEGDSELERLLSAAGGEPSKRRRPVGRVWALVAAVVALVGLVTAFEWHRRETAVLTFSANGVPQQSPFAIGAHAEHAVDLAFSDGTVFNVAPAGRLRVESSSPTGARLTLVEGKAIAHIVPRAKASWSVMAGPFEVQVTGTRFGATWDAKDERLSVELYEGSVQVVGAAFTAPISVRAGQRLEAGKGSGNWLLTSLEGPARPLESTRSASSAGAASPPLASADRPVSDHPTNGPASSASAASDRASAATRDWPALLGRADFEGIVKQANDIGIERCFSTCTPSDLRVLADSARYLGRYALAERSLLALRKRSPNDAASAAFLLARLKESSAPEEALAWYEKNLREAPAGSYAAEALAGKMRLSMQTAGPSAAAPAAEQYLARFPGGVHAARARKILSQSKTASEGR